MGEDHEGFITLICGIVTVRNFIRFFKVYCYTCI